MMIGVLKVFVAVGLEVFWDVVVVGFDDLLWWLLLYLMVMVVV